MKQKKISYPPIYMGASFMLVIFIILCMVIFAVLSLSAAAKDYEYSQKNAHRTIEYYTANNLAEEKIAEIDRTLQPDSSGNIEFAVPINDSEILKVILEVHPQDTPRYTILSWKQISTAGWSGDQTLPVLGMDK